MPTGAAPARRIATQGDIGDFAKYALLREVSAGKRLGVA